MRKERIDPEVRNEKFISLMMEGEGLTAAGFKAGFSTPQRDAFKILLEKRAQDYAKRFVKAKCIIQGMPMAYEFMYRTMNDPRQDIRVRVVCAKEIMGYGGIVAPKGAKADEDQVIDVSKMKRDDLINYIFEARKILAENAKLIEQAPQPLESYME